MKKLFRRFSPLLLAVLVLGFLAPAALTLRPTPARADATPPGFENLAEDLLPTVVNVSTTGKVKRVGMQPGLPQMPDLPPGSPFEEFFKDFYDQYKNQQPPADEKTASLGSGFIIDADNGYVVTNNHVIKDADEIKVILHDNTTLDATLVGTDDKTDIALLKVKPTKPLVAAKWGDSDKAKVGSWILAIGNPFGLGGTVTAGIVSARQRNINEGPYDDFIQTDASINKGNSGGPMFNMNGEVVGVNTAIYSPSGGSVGIGFAVPSNIAKGVVAQLVKYGKTRRGWLGVRIQEVTPEIADSLGLDHARGALVSGLTPKSPAEAAGVKAGDVLLSFDGHDIDQMHNLPRMVAESEVGRKVPVGIWRDGKNMTLDITLGQLETAEEDGLLKSADDGDGKPGAAAATGTDIPEFGMKLAPLTEAARRTYGLPPELRGVLVTEAKRDGKAAEKGVAEGDVIAEVDQQEVGKPEDVVKKIEAARKAGHATVLFFIGRKHEMRFVALKFDKAK